MGTLKELAVIPNYIEGFNRACAVLLNDNKILLTGGRPKTGLLDAMNLYNLETGQWTKSTGSQMWSFLS